MIKLGAVYVLVGLMFAAFAALSALDRTNRKRVGNAAFWGLVAVSFLAGDRLGELEPETRYAIRAQAAATDNVGAFFGEDIFLAIGSILLITSLIDSTYHLKLDALQIAVWAIPTAVCAFVIHGGRLLWLDRSLARATAKAEVAAR